MCYLTALLVVLALAAADEPPTEQAKALAAYKDALDKGLLKELGEVAAGEAGATLRKIAEPFAKAKAASDKLDKALKDKPDIGWQNPFAAGLAPLAGGQIDFVDKGKEGDLFVVRIRYGARGQEETVAVRNEAGVWRVDLPGDLVKALRPLAQPERLDRYRHQLEKLTEVLTMLAAEIESGKLKTKEAVVLRMLELHGEGS